ncbi:tetratricopeptide (TPR) repeat protein [Anaerotaenia torta]|uniref:tetratricopeptide repeat protein n=1 Tax=Anaerotaenia torta TaxID=433293 RepID=UPI003D1B82E6
MSSGIFRTKERTAVVVILGIAAIIFGFILINHESKNNRINERAVMAENYLNAGSYELAVAAYQEALAMKDSDRETLSIGLAEAYAGMKDYDKALETLRAAYQKLSTEKLEKKMEEIKSAKQDYDFLQSISRADVYFSNGEYDKAISVYEEAKLLKSKDVTSYQRIVQAYIEQGKYDLAREEVLEGIEITQSEELETLRITVDHYLLKEDYDVIISQAEEYILQENYEDGMEKYREAAELLPDEPAAYKALAGIYIQQKDYNACIRLLNTALEHTGDEELKELLDMAKEQKAGEEERENILSELCQAMEERNTDRITAAMETSLFQAEASGEMPVFFNIVGDISKGSGLIIYSGEQVYYGEIMNGVKRGTGMYFMLTGDPEKRGYYYYEGEWGNDLPNGSGRVAEMKLKEKKAGELYKEVTITEGIFYDALEDGSMKKYFYENDTETGRIKYLAQNGIPMEKNTLKISPAPAPSGKAYSIAELYRGDTATGEDYKVEPDTVWGVRPFLRTKNKR